MSWQTYIDDQLMCDVEGVHLTAAAIIGLDGSVWAQSASFPQFKPEEIANIVKDFDEPGFLAPTGLFLGGTKYMVIQGEPGAVIRGKKTELSSEQDMYPALGTTHGTVCHVLCPALYTCPAGTITSSNIDWRTFSN